MPTPASVETGAGHSPSLLLLYSSLENSPFQMQELAEDNGGYACVHVPDCEEGEREPEKSSKEM